MKEVDIVFHRADHDGKLSAWIAAEWVRRSGDLPVFVGLDYGDDIPSFAQRHVIMLDFSLPDMGAVLKSAKSLVWVDHHVTSMDKVEKSGVFIQGMRRVGEAACVLSWRYFIGTPPPKGVMLLGAYDVASGDIHSLYYENYFQCFNTDPAVFNWGMAISMADANINQVLEIGSLIQKRDENRFKTDIRSGIEVVVAGHPCLTLNSQQVGSKVFGDRLSKYSACLIWHFVGKDRIRWRAYSHGDGGMNVAALASGFGGGGHRHAAGFYTDSETGEKILSGMCQ